MQVTGILIRYASGARAKMCTLEQQQTCHLAKDFFSADDEAVMRAAFPRAYSIAIVANDTAFTDLTFSMFCNREGDYATPRVLCFGGEDQWHVNPGEEQMNIVGHMLDDIVEGRRWISTARSAFGAPCEPAREWHGQCKTESIGSCWGRYCSLHEGACQVCRKNTASFWEFSDSEI